MPITVTKINGVSYYRIQRTKRNLEFFPAVELIDTQGESGLYPMVSSVDDLRNIPEIAFFKPKSVAQKIALQRYNISKYLPSSLVKSMIGTCYELDIQEQIMNEIAHMDEQGIAFKG